MGHSNRSHSNFAASSSARWINCPASVRLCLKAPKVEFESKYAIEGTQAHECLEFVVKRYGNLNAALKIAEKKWSQDKVDYAARAADVIFELRPSAKAVLLVEQRVSFNSQLFGTLDYAWVEIGGALVVIDYKFGKGLKVYPTEESGDANTQLMYYATALARSYKYNFKSVSLVIIQPRVYAESDEIFLKAEVKVEELKKFEQRLIKAVKAAKLPNAELSQGDWCKYCPAAPICPELSENALRSADIMFSPSKGVQAVPEVTALTLEKLPIMLDACTKLERWISSVRSYAFALANAGQKIEGYKLVPKRASKTWLPDAEKKALKKFGQDIYRKEFLSPSQFQKLLDAKEFVEANTTCISSGVTLVSDSDSRDEVKDVNYFFDT